MIHNPSLELSFQLRGLKINYISEVSPMILDPSVTLGLNYQLLGHKISASNKENATVFKRIQIKGIAFFSVLTHHKLLPSP